MQMKKCKSCQKEIDSKAKKCPYCQSDQRSWFGRHPILTAILGLFVFFIVIGMASGGNGSKTGSTKNTQSESGSNSTEQVAKEEVKPTEDPNPHFSDGTYEVGKEIQPGTYRTRKASSGCYYARLSGFGNAFGDIITNENTDAPAIITIEATDKGFTSKRCGVWTQDLSAITSDKTTFGDGMYIVGTDIEPGQYKNSGQDGCYFARLANFTGGMGGIISNENTDDVAIVNIASTDKGFVSKRCGTWTKME
jgi:hypothetical protein